MSLLPLLGLMALVLLPVLAALYARRRGSGSRIRQVLFSALWFGLAGPPLGGLLVAVPAVLQLDDPEPLAMVLFFMLMAYLPGLVPAALAGACMALLRPGLGAWGRLGTVLPVGGIAAAAFGMGALRFPVESLPLIGGLGAVAGLAMEAGVLWWERRRRRRAGAVVPG